MILKRRPIAFLIASVLFGTSQVGMAAADEPEIIPIREQIMEYQTFAYYVVPESMDRDEFLASIGESEADKSAPMQVTVFNPDGSSHELASTEVAVLIPEDEVILAEPVPTEAIPTEPVAFFDSDDEGYQTTPVQFTVFNPDGSSYEFMPEDQLAIFEPSGLIWYYELPA